MNNRSWAYPYLQFLILWTQKSEDPNGHVSFTERVFNIRWFFRLSALEIIMNTYQGTLLREYMVNLRNLTQTAYKLLEAGQGVALIAAQFYHLYSIYFIISIGLVLLSCLARFWRTDEFFSATRISNIILQDATQEKFESDEMQDFLSIDRQIDQLTDVPKSYYNLTQNMLLAPLEMIMYLSILGPHILTTMAVLALFAGYWQVRLGEAYARNMRELSTAASRLSQSQLNEHLTRVQEAANATRKSKDIEIFTDLVKNGTIVLFTLLLMGLTSHFLFLGLYDLAMIMSQTATGLQAFLRITKYLGLAKNHMSFDQNISAQAGAFDFMHDSNIDDHINQLPSYNWSVTYRLALYLTLILIGAGYLLLPSMPVITSMMNLTKLVTMKQALNAALASWITSSVLLSSTEAKNIGSTTLGAFLQAAGILFAITNAAALWAISSSVIIPLIQSAPVVFSCITLISFVATYFFDQYALKPLMFALDQIGTWLMQETVMICQIPSNAASEMTNKMNDFGKGVHSYASSTYQKMPSMPRGYSF